MLITVIGIILGVIVSKECNGLLLRGGANRAKISVKTVLGAGRCGNCSALFPYVNCIYGSIAS